MSGILMETIERKLKERHDQKYNPQPGDKITNPHSTHKTVEEKRAAYNAALDRHERAYTGFQTYIHVGDPGAEFNDVEYVAGLWRVQNPTHYDTIKVQDKDFVLLDKLNRTEHTHFEFYPALSVIWLGSGQNCSNSADYIVSKYETGRGTFYAYGCKLTVPDALATARAHLAVRVYDAYQDLIEADIMRAKAEKAKTEAPDATPKIVVKFKELFKNFKKKICHKEEYEIVTIQDKQFKLLKKLDRTEHNKFEFYAAASTLFGNDPDYIVAKYETGRGTFYSYGCKLTCADALATARAHLAVRVYDAYQDLIEADTRRVLGRQK